MLQLLGKFIQHNTGRKPSQKEVENRLVQTVYYLKKTGTINISQDNKGIWLSLTRKGIAKQHKFSITTVVIPRPTKWDKSYWLVAADIPTKTHGHMADAFRRKLAQLHFYPLQRTLWLYPYNPKGQLQSLVHYFTIAPFVTLMHISELDRSDKDLAERFWKEHNIL
jgi:DNA-binding transcriptional regulator PaaX